LRRLRAARRLPAADSFAIFALPHFLRPAAAATAAGLRAPLARAEAATALKRFPVPSLGFRGLPAINDHLRDHADPSSLVPARRDGRPFLRPQRAPVGVRREVVRAALAAPVVVAVQRLGAGNLGGAALA